MRIGCSGYSYADWVGPFYPPGTRPGDMLELYAQRFGTVEVNSTYYRLPGVKTFQGMSRKVPRDFRFAVKLPGDITHRGRLEPAADFLRVTAPLAEAGQLGPVLAQFPFAFKNGQDQRAYLGRLKEAMPGVALVVEFRHESWQVPAVARFLEDRGLALAAVDAPELPGLPRADATAVNRLGYVRFHGRNAGKWFEHDRAEERYDYRYSSRELEDWTARIRAVEAATDELYIYFNNHFRGQAPANAGELAELLGKPLPMASGRLFT